MQKQGKKKKLRKPQRQSRPGLESKMSPLPIGETSASGSGKLKGKVVLVTGGDSGIGRAVAVLFAKEGAKVSIAYLNEHGDADETKEMVEKFSECLLIPGDLSKERHCVGIVKKTIQKFKKIDILVNNAAVQYEAKKLEDITTEQLLKTFSTNIFSFFRITREVLHHLPKGGALSTPRR